MGRVQELRDGVRAGAVPPPALKAVAVAAADLAERLSADLVAAGYRATPVSPGDLPDGAALLLVQPASERSLDTLRRGALELNPATYQARVGERPLDLTYMEYSLLRFLAASPGRVHTRRSILASVWGYDYYGGMRTVDVHVRRLRAKLGEEHARTIETVRSVGYRFVPEGEP